MLWNTPTEQSIFQNTRWFSVMGESLLPSRAIPRDGFHLEVSVFCPNSSQCSTSYRNVSKVPANAKNPGSLTRSQLSASSIWKRQMLDMCTRQNWKHVKHARQASGISVRTIFIYLSVLPTLYLTSQTKKKALMRVAPLYILCFSTWQLNSEIDRNSYTQFSLL